MGALGEVRIGVSGMEVTSWSMAARDAGNEVKVLVWRSGHSMILSQGTELAVAGPRRVNACGEDFIHSGNLQRLIRITMRCEEPLNWKSFSRMCLTH